MNQRFEGKVALVTGGAQGIGLAVCEHLGVEGAKIAFCDIDEEAGTEALERLEAKGIEALFVQADVASERECAAFVHAATSRFGGVHILCNNAGIMHVSPPEELSLEDFDRVIAVNLRGAMAMAKHAVPHMKAAGGGAIVNIASTRALMSEANTESYSASKGGILALTHALAISLGGYGIRVNAISPGWIETSAWKKRSARRPAELRAIDHRQHPAGRVGRPEDIARAVAFLCDPAADFITGVNLVVDGGMTVKMIYEP